MKASVKPEEKVTFYSMFLAQYIVRNNVYIKFMNEIDELQTKLKPYNVTLRDYYFVDASYCFQTPPDLTANAKDLSQRFDEFMETKGIAIDFISIIHGDHLLELLCNYHSAGVLKGLANDIDRNFKYITNIDDNVGNGGADEIPYEAHIKITLQSYEQIQVAISEFADLLYTAFESPHFENFNNDKFYKEWAKYTSGNIPNVDYRQRGLGLWMYDYCVLHGCRIFSARKALRSSGWLKNFGLEETDDRTIDRWGYGTEKCIEEAQFLKLS